MRKTFSFKTKKGKLAIGASVLTGALILAGSMAYFTDRADLAASATAGTVDLAVTESWSDVSNFAPGDIADFSYTISNDGNMAVDVRETIALHSSVGMDTATQAEFEMYHLGDVEQDQSGAYMPKAGALPIASDEDRIVSNDGKTIKYMIDEYTLNGTGADAEIVDGITATSNGTDYVLLFKDGAANTFQGSQVSIELLAEAKQHRNTDSDAWTTIATESVSIGGEIHQAVPAK